MQSLKNDLLGFSIYINGIKMNFFDSPFAHYYIHKFIHTFACSFSLCSFPQVTTIINPLLLLDTWVVYCMNNVAKKMLIKITSIVIHMQEFL